MGTPPLPSIATGWLGDDLRERQQRQEEHQREHQQERGAKDVVVMDGSMGHLCILRGVPDDRQLWSARGLVEEQYHEIVIAAHMDYIRAGCCTITTNNYAVQPNYYRRAFANDWEARIRKDTELAARLAVKARSLCSTQGFDVKILGCLPPICETHRPDLTASFIRAEGEEACRKFYKSVGEALVQGGVDAFLAESMNSWEEAMLVIEATKDLGKPLLVSMEGALRNESLQPQPQLAGEVAKKVLRAKTAEGAHIVALGFNCAPPEEILKALEAIESCGVGEDLRRAGVTLAAYANCNDRRAVHDVAGFNVLEMKSRQICLREDLKGLGYVAWCKRFVSAGAKYCGGCCGSSPEMIGELVKALAAESIIAKLLPEEQEVAAPLLVDGDISRTTRA